MKREPDWDKLAREHDRFLGDPSQQVDQEQYDAYLSAKADYEELKADEERDERYIAEQNLKHV